VAFKVSVALRWSYRYWENE